MSDIWTVIAIAALGAGFGVILGLFLAEFKATDAYNKGFDAGKAYSDGALIKERQDRLDSEIDYEAEITRLHGDVEFWRSKAENKRIMLEDKQ